MDSIFPTSSEIFEIYRQYCVGDCCMPDEESQKLRFTRAALSQLLEVVDYKLNTRVTILEESHELMLRIGLMADFSEFSRFYNFVFFICRENGQKNITVSRAVMALAISFSWKVSTSGSMVQFH